MSSVLSLNDLTDAVAEGAAFRCRTHLQPAGGPGQKVFPPTFAGATYVFEERRFPKFEADGSREFETKLCVLLDTVQSQANRMEEALQDAIDAGKLRLPTVEVDFSNAKLIDPIRRVTSLQAPHRIADAILRDSEFEGTPFRQSEVGNWIDHASMDNATPLFRISPTSLIFGMWDSTGPKGGLGAKFERLVVSEIVGVHVPLSVRENIKQKMARGVRRDPLGIRAAAQVKKTSPNEWRMAEGEKEKGAESPAGINHSNVPFDSENVGVTFDYAEQTMVLSLTGLRRLRFPDEGGWKASPEQSARDLATRRVLAALALCAAELSVVGGLDLRSRCTLWAEESRRWELLGRPGEEPKVYSLDGNSAIDLLNASLEEAKKHGVSWRTEPVLLTPSPELIKLVQRSQEIAATMGSEE